MWEMFQQQLLKLLKHLDRRAASVLYPVSRVPLSSSEREEGCGSSQDSLVCPPAVLILHQSVYFIAAPEKSKWNNSCDLR